MPLDLDLSRPLRSMPRLEDLVRAVRDAPSSTQEQPFVEWKSAGDAAERAWRAELAKQVLGMANRDPDAAAAWFGGCGYILLGVEPGSLHGTPVHDSAKVESWLAPYVGRPPDGPDWTSTYVEVDGNRVLVVTVEPPKWGDSIWACHREFSADPKAAGAGPKVVLRNGGIYVRHLASTVEHTVEDLRMLQRRLLGSRRRIGGIRVSLTTDSMAAPVDADDETVAAWAARERAALMPPAPRPKPNPGPRTGGLDVLKVGRWPDDTLVGFEKAMGAYVKGVGREPDPRTREDYMEQVEAYIGKATQAMPAFVLGRMFHRGMGQVAFLVHNDTDDPVQRLQVRVHFPVDGVMAFDHGDLPDQELPERPAMLGAGGRDRFAGLYGAAMASFREPAYDFRDVIAPLGHGVRIDNTDGVTLTFDPVDLLPRETVDLAEVWLFTSVEHAGASLTADWSARSLDASGVLPGKVVVPVEAQAPAIEELIAEPAE